MTVRNGWSEGDSYQTLSVINYHGDDYHVVRFLKDNIELERQQAIRDIMVKRDIARWLQVRLGMIHLHLITVICFRLDWQRLKLGTEWKLKAGRR